MRSLRVGRVDLLAYARAFPLLVRNPQIALAPLLAAVVQVLLFIPFSSSGGTGLLGSANSSIIGLIGQLITSFGLALALIVAESAWRRGRAPFDDAWDEARRKAGGILLAAIGFNFIIYVAGLVGGLVGPIGSIVLTLVAYVFFIYTIPAAAIGGIPGGAALQASFERAQRTVLATVIVTALYFFAINIVPSLIIEALSPILLGGSFFASGVVVSLAGACFNALAMGYVALVLAKMYDDASYGRFY